MRFYLAMLVALVAAASLLFATFGPSLRTFLDLVLVVLALMPMIIKHTPKLHLALAKASFRIKNSAVTWDLNVRYAALTKPLSLDEILAQLATRSGEGFTLRYRTESQASATLFRNLTVEISKYHPFDPEGSSELEITLGITPVAIGYRESQVFLDERLVPTLNIVKDLLAPEWVSYTLRVDFGSVNPFFGLYVQQLSLEYVKDFMFEFKVPSITNQGTVTVGKQHLTVVAATLEDFRRSATAALAFQIPRS